MNEVKVSQLREKDIVAVPGGRLGFGSKREAKGRLWGSERANWVLEGFDGSIRDRGRLVMR